MSEPSDDLTSFHVQRSAANDRASIAWLVSRFTPLLLAQCQQRLPPSLRRFHDADDVLADVWVTVLGALPRLAPSDGSRSLGFLRYASTVLVHRIRDLLEKHVINKPRVATIAESDSAAIPPSAIADDARGVITHVIAEERRGRVWQGLESLEQSDREIVVLHGLEGRPHREIGAFLGLAEGAVAVRYHRALKRLRGQLGASIFDDLAE